MLEMIKNCSALSELEDKCSEFIMDLEETGQYIRYLANEIEIKWRYEAGRLGIELRLEVSIVTCFKSDLYGNMFCVICSWIYKTFKIKI